MGRSEIRSILKWFKYEDRDYLVSVLDRDEEGAARLRDIPLRRVERITSWALYLDDGDTVIPLHRVYMVKDREGRVVWRRGQGS
ncbi:MAG: RNA repair domain-containing protein [Desulfurococcales archaeon]|nr:RNA repair domain-containing protein [Desulfurococcales archaeon]